MDAREHVKEDPLGHPAIAAQGQCEVAEDRFVELTQLLANSSLQKGGHLGDSSKAVVRVILEDQRIPVVDPKFLGRSAGTALPEM